MCKTYVNFTCVLFFFHPFKLRNLQLNVLLIKQITYPEFTNCMFMSDFCCPYKVCILNICYWKQILKKRELNLWIHFKKSLKFQLARCWSRCFNHKYLQTFSKGGEFLVMCTFISTIHSLMLRMAYRYLKLCGK